MPFYIQFRTANGEICAALQSMKPPVMDGDKSFIELPAAVNTMGKAVDLATKQLVDCPKYAAAAHNEKIYALLRDIDEKSQRAIREWIITGDKSKLVELETRAAALRLQLL